MEATAFACLWAAANLLAAALALAATLFYVFVYSIWLKPRTTNNIVIGGAAGAMPVLVGWAAVRGDLAWPAVVLFAVIFAWTPADFWALAVRYRADYEAGGVPMLPVVAGPERTALTIFRYAAATVALTLGLGPVADLGPVYLASAIVLGGVFLHRSYGLRYDVAPERAMALFRLSNIYLALVFGALAADVLVR